MWNLQFMRAVIAAALVLGMPALAPPAAAQSLSSPIRIGTTTANNGPTLGIPRWKGYMLETNPNHFWASYSNGSRFLSNVTYTTDGGNTWSTNPIQIEPLGYLDMHCSVTGRDGNMYATWPSRNGISFRRFRDPFLSNADAELPVIMAGTSYGHRSNIMVQNTGRLWLFTRLTGSASQNVRYNYSDDEGVSWSQGMAYATNQSEVRIGSMPYVDGNPALIVLYLNSPRGFEYYLWDGTEFKAEADHSIYGVNMGYTRAFSHNVIRDTTFHLVFGDGTSLHHVWKDFNNGAGSWNHEIIDSSATTLDNNWYPTTTVRGDDLYLFYCKRSTTSQSTSDIYYKKWSQQAKTWTAPQLVSTDAASVSNVQPNTGFHVPANSPYVPVYWQSGTSPYDIMFARVEVTGTPVIACPTNPLIANMCAVELGCVPLVVENCDSVTVSPPGATWSNGQLFFPATVSGTQVFHVTGYAADTTLSPVSCDVTVTIEGFPIVQITCPPTINDIETCFPTSLSLPLSIVNQTEVQVAGAVWADDQLTFTADTTGTYTFQVTASNSYSSDTCELQVGVVVSPSVDLFLADTDVLSSPLPIAESDTILLSAEIHSDLQSRPASDITVHFYTGDPDLGGVLIGADEIVSVLNGGESATASVSYIVAEELPHDIYVRVDPNELISECDEANNAAKMTLDGTFSFFTAHGTVSTVSTPVRGVVIDLLDGDGIRIASITTDFYGQYSFASIPAGDYYLDLQLPLGFVPVGGSLVSIPSGTTDFLADFFLQDATIGGNNTFWWWKWQLLDIREGTSGPGDVTEADVDELCAAIFDHFCDRDDEFAIAIQGVTCTGTPNRALTFADVDSLWFDVDDNSYAARTRKYFLACLFNVASARLSQRAVVSLDGATASQAITYFAERYLNGGSGESLLWYNLSQMFSNVMIAPGVIPLTTANVLYKTESGASDELLPNRLSLSQNYPNPFNPTTTIAYSVPVRSRVLIRIYNVLGQAVKTLIDDETQPGTYEVVWDGTDNTGRQVGSGIYLYRVTANNQSVGKKMLLLK